MTIKDIAARLAVENGLNQKTAERLIRAETNLMKQYFRQLSKISTENIATRRYTQDPSTSELAAVSAPLLVQIINENPSATPAQQAAVKEYITVIKEVEKEQEPFGIAQDSVAPGYTRVTFTGVSLREDVTQTYDVYNGANLAEIEEAGRKTVGARRAVPKLEEDFRDLIEGRITAEEYTEIVTQRMEESEHVYYAEEYSDYWRDPEEGLY